MGETRAPHLRVLHVLAHHSDERRYGGPNTVALAQARALTKAGHIVNVLAATDGLDRPTATEVDGTAVMLFPARYLLGRHRFAGLHAPGALRWLRRNLSRFDVVHVHLARDGFTLPAALIAGQRGALVVQPHGMLAADTSIKRSFDRLLLSRLISHAKGVACLTEQERDSLRSRFSGRFQVVRNAYVQTRTPGISERKTPAVVLFLARLNARKRPTMFARAALSLVESGTRAEFVLAGPDEGEADELIRIADASGGRVRLVGAVSADDVPALMGSASVYVLPAANEPFGMTLLEAVAAGTPVIAAADSVLGRDLTDAGAGRLFDGTSSSLADAIAAALVDDHQREFVREHGQEIVARLAGERAMLEELENLYRDTL